MTWAVNHTKRARRDGFESVIGCFAKDKVCTQPSHGFDRCVDQQKGYAGEGGSRYIERARRAHCACLPAEGAHNF